MISKPLPAPQDKTRPKPLPAPQANRIDKTLEAHGDVRIDPYYWLRDRDNPQVIALLSEENDYYSGQTSHMANLEDEIFHEIKSRVLETDLSFPVLDHGYYYYTRTIEGLQYPIHCRRKAQLASSGKPYRPTPEINATIESTVPLDEMLLDENIMANDSEYFALGAFDLDINHKLLAYSTDLDGSELYDLYVKDIASSKIIDGPIEDTYYGLAWSNDSNYLFYVRTDSSMRPHQVWRHKLLTSCREDRLVYEETDVAFSLSIGTTKDNSYILIDIESKTSSETLTIDANFPLEEPQVILPRSANHEYSVEHHQKSFVVLTNLDAEDFKIISLDESTRSLSDAVEIIPHRLGTRIEGFEVFNDFVTVLERKNATTSLSILPGRIDVDGSLDFKWIFESIFEIPKLDEVSSIWEGDNPEMNTSVVRYGYSSLTTPSSLFEFDLETSSTTLLKQQPVLGDFDQDNYESSRLWATAPDGAQIPISLVRSKKSAQITPQPCLLYGYGSYEISIDPSFSISRLSLLDRGFIFAIAHVRGGGEMGRRWYLDGKLDKKMHTFDDFITCTKFLIDNDYTTPEQLVARGGSAGGLLMGVVLNKAPELYAGVIAEVPFVDCLTTILDETLPLTSSEWEEWGNPITDLECYHYMKSYSPYDNIRADVTYPAILVTAGLNDPRVAYWEPAKWVAKIRHCSPGTQVFLKTEMGAGHQGPSGRYDAWRDEAKILAFAVDIVKTTG